MRTCPQRSERGFSLIGLMTAVAIIGILAAIAIPKYQDYVMRTRWADAITSVGSLEIAVGDCLQNNKSDLTQCQSLALLQGTNAAAINFWPPATLPTFAKYGGVTVTMQANSVIQLAGATAALGTCTVTLTPTVNTGTVTWILGRAAGAGCTRSNTGAGT